LQLAIDQLRVLELNLVWLWVWRFAILTSANSIADCLLQIANWNQLFDILGKLLEWVSNPALCGIDHTILEHTKFLVGLKFMWSGNKLQE